MFMQRWQCNVIGCADGSGYSSLESGGLSSQSFTSIIAPSIFLGCFTFAIDLGVSLIM